MKGFLVSFVLLLIAVICGISYFEQQGVRNVTFQTIHYFSRPHEGIRTTPLLNKAAWRGSELDVSDWKESLSNEQIIDIENTLIHAANSCHLNLNTTIQEEDELAPILSKLTKNDCPFGHVMENTIERWKQKISVNDMGFRVISGVPVEKWTIAKSELFFWCVGLHLGRTGAQNNEGHLLGHVRDIGGDHSKDRQFKSSGFIKFHCDGADVVGLLSLSKPMEGGTSRIISSVTVYNEFVKEKPNLVNELYEYTALDARGTGGIDFLWIKPLRYYNDILRTFWHEEYFSSAFQLTNAPQQSEKQREAHEFYSSILSRNDLYLDMELEVGDIQFCSNHVILHSRTGYTDFPREEDEKLGIDRRRHLLRLWLSIEEPIDIWERIHIELSRAEVLFWSIEAKLRQLF